MIRGTLEKKQCCSAAFLDITQASDKVWHPDLLFKSRKHLSYEYYRISESYLTDRHFQVKFQDEITILRKNDAGVPQGNVLGPDLRVYLTYKSDLLTSDKTTATFADIAILVTHEDSIIASIKLQATINKIDDWAKKWKIKINESKSTHITFTLRNQTCPAVQMGNVALLKPMWTYGFQPWGKASSAFNPRLSDQF
jgi:hypothetical protein